MRQIAGQGETGQPEQQPGRELTPEVRLTAALVLVARRWRSLMDEHLRPMDQSAARMEALSAINNAPKPCSQADIAQRLRIEGPTMTRMVDALSRDGLVERIPSPHDRRTKHLELTDAGRVVLAEVWAVCDGLRARLLADLADDEAQAMQHALDGLLARLDRGL